jgi:hypothetical protein
MFLARLVQASLVLAGILAAYGASAQQNADGQLREIQLAPDAFTLQDPVPAWVDPAIIPNVTKSEPIVVRLADTQYLVDKVPAVYVPIAVA